LKLEITWLIFCYSARSLTHGVNLPNKLQTRTPGSKKSWGSFYDQAHHI
jgi:hypothetical protein